MTLISAFSLLITPYFLVKSHVKKPIFVSSYKQQIYE